MVPAQQAPHAALHETVLDQSACNTGSTEASNLCLGALMAQGGPSAVVGVILVPARLVAAPPASPFSEQSAIIR